jgi:hypothetical protein
MRNPVAWSHSFDISPPSSGPRKAPAKAPKVMNSVRQEIASSRHLRKNGAANARKNNASQHTLNRSTSPIGEVRNIVQQVHGKPGRQRDYDQKISPARPDNRSDQQ